MSLVYGNSDLATQISDASPSGENIQYDQLFLDMQLAAQYRDEQQVGDAFKEAAPPDFAALGAAARAVLLRSHDLRAAVYLAESALAQEGVVSFAKVLELIATYIRNEWAECHPQPDEDDGDVTMRVNAVAGLSDRRRVIAQLRHAPLTQSHAFGRLSLRDIEIVDGRLPPPLSGPVPDINTLQAAFKDTPEEAIADLRRALSAAQGATAQIDAIFATRSPGDGPSLDLLNDTLRAMDQALSRFLGNAPAAGDASAADGGLGPAAAQAVCGVPGAINDPDDVISALDRIIAYYNASEPSSPIPIILARARRLVRADFMTIIKDMAQEGLDQVHRIGGISDDD